MTNAEILKAAKEMAGQMGGADVGTNPTFALATVCLNLAEQLVSADRRIQDLDAIVRNHIQWVAEAAARIEALETTHGDTA